MPVAIRDKYCSAGLLFPADSDLLLDGYRMRCHKYFLLKRIVLPCVIGVLALSGFIIPDSPHEVAAYMSFSTPMIASSYRSVSKVDLPQKRLLIVSDEVTLKIAPSPTPTPTPEPTRPWGQARQVDEHTWTMSVGSDDSMASSSDILSALNVYRRQKGKGELSFDSKLQEFAQKRAEFFASSHNLDGHAGFQDYINNQDGFKKLGFYGLGENSSIGYHVTGTHLIEWVYAGDKPHDDNQLNSEWTHVGIGVSGDATDLVFGGKKQ